MLKKVLASVLAGVLVFGTAAVMPEGAVELGSMIKANANEVLTYGDFEYTYTTEGTVMITKYNGNDTEVTIPASIGGKDVTVVDVYAFENCKKLESIKVNPDSESFAALDGILYDKNMSRIIYVPRAKKTATKLYSELRSIEDGTFKDRTELTKVVIPDSVEYLGEDAFAGCESLTEVNLPKGIAVIERGTFDFCTSLKSITIPKGVMIISDWAFYGCESLESISVEAGNEYYVSYGGILYNNDMTEIVDIPDAIKTVTFPRAFTVLKDNAFCNCKQLTTVTIHDKITEIGDDAFYGCTSLTGINVDADNEYYSSVDGLLYNKAKTTLICCPGGKTGVTIPSSVTSIGMRAFCGCENLKTVTIPATVTSIGASAFDFCSALEEITIPNSITTIENDTFYGCSGLKKVTIPDSVKTIEPFAFYACESLTDVTIPNGVTDIGERTFYLCQGLSSVTIPESVTTIGDCAYAYCENLETITIPDSVTSIDDYTFLGCKKLTIKCNKGSYAESYAKAKGINYEQPHKHSYIPKVTKEPTCTEDGVKTYTCATCNDTYTEAIPATGHTYDAVISTYYPTCTKDGYKTYTCKCGLSYSEPFGGKATGHNYTTKVINPTYDAQGYTLHICANCEDMYKDNYTAKLTRTSIAKAKVTGISNKTYTGKAITQKPTVKLGSKTLKSGTDYTVSYKSNKAVGTATVTITGKGAYTGSVKATFKINPKKTTLKTVTSPKTKQLKATYSKVAGVTGYQITYSTSSKFTKATTKSVNASGTSKTISKLTKGKTYYVKVRAYKTVGKTKYYSGYSAVKKVKVK